MAAAQGQEFKLRVPKNLVKDYYVMKLASARPVKFDTITEAYMARKATQYEEETASAEPSFGAGSVYGKERKEEARKKRRGIMKKKINPHDMPFTLRLGPKSSNAKIYSGKKEGGILDNSSYYVLTQTADGVFEAVPIHAWFNFTPDINYTTMTADEAEFEFSKRDKTINLWNLKIKQQLDDKQLDDEGDGKASTSKVDSNEGGLKIHDDENLSDGVDVEEFSDDSSSDDGKKKSKKKQKESKRSAAAKKSKKNKKGSDNEDLPSDEEEELENAESKEMDYLSESSGEEIEIEDEPEPEKANDKAKDDLNAAIMSDSSEEDDDENEEGEKLTDVGKELKQIMHRDEKEDGSSGDEEEDEEDIDDDDEKYSKSAVFMQGKDSKKKRSSGNNSGSASNSRSATPTMNTDNTNNKSTDNASSTPDGGKKKSGSKRPLQTTPSPSSKKQKLTTTTTGQQQQQQTSTKHHHHHHKHNSAPEEEDGAISEKAIRRYLVHKPMTTTDLVRKFKRKRTGLTKKETVDTIAAILKKIEPNRVHKDNVLYLSLKPN